MVFDAIRSLGLIGQHFCLLGMKGDARQSAFVSRCEEILVEFTFHQFCLAQEAGFDNLVVFQF